MSGNLSVWLTPLWMLSIGVTGGSAVLLVLYAVLWIVSRRAAAAVSRAVRESVLQPVSYLALAFVVLCALVPVAQIAKFWPVVESLRRLPYVTPIHQTVEIPAQTDDMEVPLSFSADDLHAYKLVSEQDLVISIEPGKALSAPLLAIDGNEPYQWTPGGIRERQFNGDVEKIYVTNLSDAPTTLTMDFERSVPIPQVRHIPIVAAAVVGLFLAYLALNWLLPRLSAVALATTKECSAQPLYLLMLFGGIVALFIFIVLPYNTFGEDVKILKDSGLTTIMVASILVGVWSASVSVAEEIEGRTALTVLSKPISRAQFVLGKFLGIIWPLLLMYIVLGAVLLLTVSYKVVYDARETTNPDPTWQTCYGEMIGTVPGLALAFMETVVMTAISVAISTRLSMMPNLIVCGSIYVLGHLIPPIVQSSAGENEFVAFVGRLSAIIVPVLDHFNIQAAVAGGVAVPWVYLGWALIYCLMYTTAMMLLALVLFEDRDLA
jgi:ABC-type transport system involved in multi-copper enzyme maturation permease subunit